MTRRELAGASGQTTAELRSIIDAAHEAFISMDAGGFITDWNPQAERTFGWSRKEAVGQVLADLIIPPSYREAHWAGLQRFLDTGEGPVLGKRLELTALHREGFEFPVELTISAAPAGEQFSFHAFLHDISDRKRGEQYAAAQHAVTSALAAVGLARRGRAAPAAGARGEPRLGGWRRGGRSTTVTRRFAAATSGPSRSREPAFEQASRKLVLARGEGLPGRVWETGEPAVVDDVRIDKNFPRAAAATAGRAARGRGDSADRPAGRCAGRSSSSRERRASGTSGSRA